MIKYDDLVKKQVDQVLNDNGVSYNEISGLSKEKLANLIDDHAFDIMESWASTKLY